MAFNLYSDDRNVRTNLKQQGIAQDDLVEISPGKLALLQQMLFQEQTAIEGRTDNGLFRTQATRESTIGNSRQIWSPKLNRFVNLRTDLTPDLNQ